MQRQSRAIILRRVGYGEADWIVTFLCREQGRMSGIAKSARSSQRRFGGALEPGSIVDLKIAARPNMPLVRLEESTVAWPTIGTLRSLERIGAVTRALALALAFLPERDPSPEKFDLLVRRIRAIAERDPLPHESVAFELEWLARCGFGATIGSCAACGRTAASEGRWSFDFDRGGLVCSSCGAAAVMRAPLSTAACQGFLSVAGMLEGGREEDAEAARGVIGRYVDHVLGRTLAVR